MADQQCSIIVMASGNGSNFQELIDAVAAGRIANSRIIRLVTNRQKAYAISRAEKAGIPWDCFNLISNGFISRGEKDEKKVAEARGKYDAALADKILSEEKRPDLRKTEEFDGAFAIERAFDEFKAGRLTRTGIMAHYVVLEVDRGEPIVTQEVEWHGEELEEFKEKMHSHEHKLIVDATAKVVEKILKEKGGK
ncbi:hypothetical protein Trco_003135 [Trichoderma cornu-damae]|uniref:phosphoribosylglycinamide formyltransferase 1 n=1 Tax=Trichoderma cornu-damae TaxID=654480 RepID=A0A9P8TZS8_9HYPO|nr:hypothetical protein Trco_003135 [Trichoderma cornu-damae]